MGRYTKGGCAASYESEEIHELGIHPASVAIGRGYLERADRGVLLLWQAETKGAYRTVGPKLHS